MKSSKLTSPYLPQNHQARPNRIIPKEIMKLPHFKTFVLKALSGMALAVEYAALVTMSPTAMRSRMDTRSRSCATMDIATATHAIAEAPPMAAVPNAIKLMMRTESAHGSHTVSMGKY